MSEKPYSVLFLCTGNSSRSIMAESILNAHPSKRFAAYSAGSLPRGVVDPATIDFLKTLNRPTETLRSKSWEAFAGADAPALDFVFTVCDKAAAEPCPVWPGQPMSAHWGVPDPIAFAGTPAEKAAFLADVYRMLNNRIRVFAELPLASLDRLTLQRHLDDIGAVGAKDGENA
ncbi:MAG: arsenate reductase ArsC [Marivibrio sp.]|uniref:arsenate reductase ArsC n=1 Tax=Marivibrio sp. TaxID=2039719 RepID=UPI0032EE562A